MRYHIFYYFYLILIKFIVKISHPVKKIAGWRIGQYRIQTKISGDCAMGNIVMYEIIGIVGTALFCFIVDNANWQRKK